jgi:hypothetical protein
MREKIRETRLAEAKAAAAAANAAKGGSDESVDKSWGKFKKKK